MPPPPLLGLERFSAEVGDLDAAGFVVGDQPILADALLAAYAAARQIPIILFEADLDRFAGVERLLP